MKRVWESSSAWSRATTQTKAGSDLSPEPLSFKRKNAKMQCCHCCMFAEPSHMCEVCKVYSASCAMLSQALAS